MPYADDGTTLRSMMNIPPPAEELRILDQELRQLEARRNQLLARRTWLLNVLAARTPVQAPPSAPGAWPPPAPAATSRTSVSAPPRPSRPAGRSRAATGGATATPDVSAPGVQNALLLLGGVLLTVAAVVFTVVSWGQLGIAGRSMVLGAVTLAALGTPVPLLRRQLTSTAEAVAGLGLALTVLDAYALHRTALPDTGGQAYAAAASALLAALWTAYGLRFHALRVPLPAAVAVAQLPLLFLAAATSPGAHVITAILLATAGADTVLALRMTAKAPRVVATAGGCGTGAWGLLACGWLSWTASTPAAAVQAGALLVSAALIALLAARRLPWTTACSALALTGGLAVLAAAGGLGRSVLPAAWTVPAYLVCGMALTAALRTVAPGAVRSGLGASAAVVQGLAVLWALPVALVALLGPAGWTARVWDGAPAGAREGVTAGHPAVFSSVPHPAVAVLVLAVAAGVLGAIARSRTLCADRLRPAALCCAVALICGALMAVPAAYELPYTAAVAIPLPLTAALLALAVLPSGWYRPTPSHADGTGPDDGVLADQPGGAGTGGLVPRPDSGPAVVAPAPPDALRLTATVVAMLVAGSGAALALASEPATIVTFAVLTVLFALSAGAGAKRWQKGTADGAGAGSAVVLSVAAAASAAVVCAAALACAAGASLGVGTSRTALLLLPVPACAALLAARPGRPAWQRPVVIGGALTALLAVGLAAGDPAVLAPVLALNGAIAAAMALREEWRRPAGTAAAVLFVLALWVQLVSWKTTTVEAYTLPAAVSLLAAGIAARRRDSARSSWAAYGWGLGVGLVPSLLAVEGDAHWRRPLLLGLAALAVTLIGARRGLQAPLVLGGGVLVLDALHELAPYVVQAIGVLPRWVLPALIGLILLALGATYEQRLRDGRRMREALRRMR